MTRREGEVQWSAPNGELKQEAPREDRAPSPIRRGQASDLGAETKTSTHPAIRIRRVVVLHTSPVAVDGTPWCNVGDLILDAGVEIFDVVGDPAAKGERRKGEVWVSPGAAAHQTSVDVRFRQVCDLPDLGITSNLQARQRERSANLGVAARTRSATHQASEWWEIIVGAFSSGVLDGGLLLPCPSRWAGEGCRCKREESQACGNHCRRRSRP